MLPRRLGASRLSSVYYINMSHEDYRIQSHPQQIVLFESLKGSNRLFRLSDLFLSPNIKLFQQSYQSELRVFELLTYGVSRLMSEAPAELASAYSLRKKIKAEREKDTGALRQTLASLEGLVLEKLENFGPWSNEVPDAQTFDNLIASTLHFCERVTYILSESELFSKVVEGEVRFLILPVVLGASDRPYTHGGLRASMLCFHRERNSSARRSAPCWELNRKMDLKCVDINSVDPIKYGLYGLPNSRLRRPNLNSGGDGDPLG